MKSVVRWSPKLKPGKQPGKDDIVECKEQLPLSRLAAIVAIGVLISIGMGAILAISGPRLKKNATPKLDAAEPNVQNMQQAGRCRVETHRPRPACEKCFGLPFFGTYTRCCAKGPSRKP